MLSLEIRLKGEISSQWLEWLDDLTISYAAPDQTVITGQVADQAAIFGLLANLWALGLSLISVEVDAPPKHEVTIHVNARAIIERKTNQGVEILVQERRKPKEGRPCIELPGGRIEPFEGIIEALQREVREETGLELTHIQGLAQRVETQGASTNLECLSPFAVYQTLQGPVDSMGVYFRCQAVGEPLKSGDDTECIHWMPVEQIDLQLQTEPEEFSWVDRAGLIFYLSQRAPNGA